MNSFEIDIIQIAFSSALFINAMLFIPQAIKLWRTKSTLGLSLITFGGFNLIQIAVILHGIILKDFLLILGYSISLITCGIVTLLIIFFRLKKRNFSDKPIPQQYDKSLLETIVAILPGNVYWKDTEGHHLGCNNNQLKVLGLTPKQYIGKNNLEIQKDKVSAKQIMENDQLVITSGKPMTFEESLIDSYDNKIIYLSNKVPLKDPEGRIIGILGVSLDITDRKKLQNNLNAKNASSDRFFLAKMIEEITGLKVNEQDTIEEHAKIIRNYFENLPSMYY